MADMPVPLMLATELPEAQLPHLQGNWIVQRKFDGDRMLLSVELDGTWSAFSRTGGAPRLTREKRRIVNGFVTTLHARAGGSWLLDCELLDDRLVVFQVVAARGGDVGYATAVHGTYDSRRDPEPYRFVDWLGRLDVYAGGSPHTEVASAWVTREPPLRIALLDAAREQGWEGLMLRADGGYHPGRSDKLRKVKFTATASVVVSAIGVGGKSNAAMIVWDAENLAPDYHIPGAPFVVPVGEVGTPRFVPAIGDVLEVRFLYVSDDWKLVQPRILRRRTDQTPNDCTLAQLIPHRERHRTAKS